jgi:hypothetical protein
MAMQANQFRQGLASEVTAKLKAKEAAEKHFKKVAVAANKAYNDAQDDYNTAFTEHAQLQELLGTIDAALAKHLTNGKTTPVAATATTAPVKGKPGPKPGLKSKASPAKGKPGPKAKAAGKKGGKKKEAGSQTFVERLVSILGTTSMSAGELEQALIDSGKPPTSKNLRGYISSVLSSSTVNGKKDGKRVFYAVERGRYCVATHKAAAIAAAKKAPKAAKASKAAPKSKASPKASKAAKVAAAPAPEPEATPEVSLTPAEHLVAEVGLPPGAFSEQPTAPLS